MQNLTNAKQVMSHFRNESLTGRVFNAEEYLQASSLLIAFSRCNLCTQ